MSDDKDDKLKQVKRIFTKIRKSDGTIKKEKATTVEDFHKLRKLRAHTLLKCKPTQLAEYVDGEKKPTSNLYRLSTQANMEYDLGLAPNTLRGNWTREIQASANRLKIESDVVLNYYKQVWTLASKKAANQSTKVDINYINDAIEYASILMIKRIKEGTVESKRDKIGQPKQSGKSKSQKPNPKANKNSVINLFDEIKMPAYRKKIITIKYILSGNDDLQKIFKKICALPELERTDLIALIESDKNLMEKLTK